VQARNRRVTTPSFVFLLHLRDHSAEDPARLGITAARKIGHAPLRNRAKRLVRAAFRATRTLWQAGLDVVVIVRRLAKASKLDDVLTEWVAAAPAIEREVQRARSYGSASADPSASRKLSH
jgi:ribonuclease P protein component